MKKAIMAVLLIAFTATGAFAEKYGFDWKNVKPEAGKFNCTIEYKTPDREIIDVWNVSRLAFREKMMEFRKADAFYACYGVEGSFEGVIEFCEYGISGRYEKENPKINLK